VAAVAEVVGAPHIDLVGHSLGAAIATVLAAERPELVRTLTLVAGFLTADEPRLKLTFELWRRLIAADREGFIQLLALTTLSDKFFASPLAAHLDALALGILNGTNWEGLARQVELDLQVDIHAEAGRVSCPTLVVGCSHDQIVTRTRDLCDLPDATFSEINDRISRHRARPPESRRLVTHRVVSCGTSMTAGNVPTLRLPQKSATRDEHIRRRRAD
jgi:3-oxoadipate enol-lactonase